VGERHAQLRLSEPIIAARGDRVVLRRETTVGGATVIDPAPPRHRSLDRMDVVERGDIAAAVDAPVHVNALRHLVDGDLVGVERAGPWVFSASWLAELEAGLRARIARADPLDPGVALPSEPWAADVSGLLPFERRGALLYLPGAAASLAGREQEAERVAGAIAAAGMTATKVDDPDLARHLEREGALVRLADGFVIARVPYEAARDALLTECRVAGEITLARFRDLVGTGRRDAQLLLERFDRDGLTRRLGDRRVLRRAGRES
jgi:selenocysteine-specific elongation factor